VHFLTFILLIFLVILSILASALIAWALIRKGRRVAGYLLLVYAALACGGLMFVVQGVWRSLGKGWSDIVAPTCQATLSDEQVAARRDAILSLPALRQLTQEADNIQFRLSNCAVNDQVGGLLDFTLPPSYSQFGVIYRPIIDFHLAWANLDEITLVWDNTPLPMDYVAISDRFRAKIMEYESAPEVREYLAYQKPGTTILYAQSVAYITEGVPRSTILYWLSEHRVASYNLPNSMRWPSFPEIEQAHQIVQQHLLTGKLAQCQIGMEGLFSLTAREVIPGKDAYRMRVHLQCPDKVRQAGLDLYPDGHFEKLEIVWEGG